MNSLKDCRIPDIPLGYCMCGCGGRTNIAGETDGSKGWVAGQPLRYIRGHRRPKPIPMRFWGAVKKTLTCWGWTKSKHKFGYGQFSVRISRNKWRPIHAHRMAWLLTKGPIPEGMFVLHNCDNPTCVNPEHLTLGNQQENIRQMIERGRRAQVPVGEKTYTAKLSVEIVRRLRFMARSGLLHVKKEAEKYGVNRRTIWCAVSGRLWKHVTAEGAR